MSLESSLIKEVISNKKEAKEALYDRYAPLLLGICIRYCGNRHDAEDVLHDAFIKILSGIHRFIEKPNSSFEGWLRRIAVNTALNFIRERSKKKKIIEENPFSDNLPYEDDETDDSFAEMISLLGKDEIMQMICELPAGYRTVFNLYVFEDYSHKEITGVLNCTENTSKSQLFKARGILKKRILELTNKQLIQNEKR
jgi:RNA polymerase sigma-70 factor, ECF subfamily